MGVWEFVAAAQIRPCTDPTIPKANLYQGEGEEQYQHGDCSLFLVEGFTEVAAKGAT